MLFRSTPYVEHWSVYIDYNQNQSFDDMQELVASVSTTDNSPTLVSFAIPNFALNGATRMRVQMKFGSAANSCESFQYGEVEDYTVIIQNASQLIDEPVHKIKDPSMELLQSVTAYPNPASDMVNVELNNFSQTPVTVRIVSLTGQEVIPAVSQTNVQTISLDIAKLQAGIYLIETKSENMQPSFTKLIKK